VNKKDTFARLRFVTTAGSVKAIDDYDKLHEANCACFERARKDFYQGVVRDPRRVSECSSTSSGEICSRESAFHVLTGTPRTTPVRAGTGKTLLVVPPSRRRTAGRIPRPA
jgi:hypothetical protein